MAMLPSAVQTTWRGPIHPSGAPDSDYEGHTDILYIIREYGSTLYVGLARAVSPTNTNFRLTILLTRLQEGLYEDLAA